MTRTYPQYIIVRIGKRSHGVAKLTSWSSKSDCPQYEIVMRSHSSQTFVELRLFVEEKNDKMPHTILEIDE